MAAKKHAKTCAYCGEKKTDSTADHVIPECLWDDRPLPNGIVTVRSCSSCNGYWSLHEGKFRTVLAMTADDSHELVRQMAGGVVQRHLNKDGKFRQQIIGSMRLVPSFSDIGLYTGNKAAFSFDWTMWDAVVGKIVRGMVFHDLGVPLDRKYVVQSWRGNGFWENKAARQNIDTLSGKWSNMGGNDDVFMGQRGGSVAEPHRRLFLLLFYRSVAIFAWTAPVSELEFPDPSHPDFVRSAQAARRQGKRSRSQ